MKQHFAVVTAQGAHFVVKNHNYGGQQECLAIQGARPNFRVTQSELPACHAKPQAYPFILRGCSWGTCSALQRRWVLDVGRSVRQD